MQIVFASVLLLFYRLASNTYMLLTHFITLYHSSNFNYSGTINYRIA